MVSSSGGAALRLVTTQPMISRAQPAPGWQPSPASRPQNSSIQETGQRVSLNKRDKDPELETKTTPETSISAGQPGPLKVRGDYLQPRDREVINRPASTPLSTPSPMVASQHQYEVPAATLPPPPLRSTRQSLCDLRATETSPSSTSNSCLKATQSTWLRTWRNPF